MILARCPACQTVFRVRPEQLRTHHGQVRCGHCYSPFNALEHLLEEPPADAAVKADAAGVPDDATAAHGASAPAPASAAPGARDRAPEATATPARKDRFFVLEERQRAPAERAPGPGFLPSEPADRATTQAATGAPERAESAEPEPTQTAEPTPPPQPQPAEPALDWAEPPPLGTRAVPPRSGSTFDDLADRLEFGLPDSFLTVTKARAEEPVAPPPVTPSPPPATAPTPPDTHKRPDVGELPDFPELFAPETEPAPARTDRPAREPNDDPMTAPTIMPELDESSTAAALRGPAGPQTPYISDDAPSPEQLDAAYGPLPSKGGGRRWLWSVGIGILLGALAVQAAYVFRDDIARRWPQLRPLYVAVCERLGCSMPLPRIAAAISIENSDLQSDPARPGRFLLNALIRNRADHVQALPHLELTLTDARDQPVVRRVFAPEDWVLHDEPARGFLAGEELAVHLPFAAPGVAASGYRVYVFYP